jgi:hypothetical protein
MRIHQNKKYGKLTRPGNGWDAPVDWLKTQEKGSNVPRKGNGSRGTLLGNNYKTF